MLAGLALMPALRDASAPQPAAYDVQLARRLMAQYQCGSCHAIAGVAGADGTRAPTLAGFAKRSYIAGVLPNHGELLERWIVDPPALLPGSTMPAMGVSVADARTIAQYLRGQP